MKRNLQYILAVLLVSLIVSNSFSQSTGTLTFTVTTSNAGGPYQPKHIMAIWIETSNGTFVKTRLKRAQMYAMYLTYWKASSNNNVVDATTGATMTNHSSPNSPYTVTWDGKDVNGNLVADGNYRLCIELSDKNATGNYSTFAFVKGPSNQNQNPANVASFSNMTLNWVSTVGIESNTINNVTSVFPNPFTTETTIDFMLKEACSVSTNIYSINGELVKSITSEYKTIGLNKISWNGNDNNGNKVPVGVYYYIINSNNNSFSGKIVYTK